MKENNIILTKSYQFSLRIVRLYVFLQKDKKSTELSRQIVRSGTSIGANIEEAIAASSRKDFISKMNIAHKEARETRYWLKLFRDVSFIDERLSQSLLNDCEELLKILTAILNTTKNNSILHSSFLILNYKNRRHRSLPFFIAGCDGGFPVDEETTATAAIKV